MHSFIDYAGAQYQYVLESRQTLFEFCSSIASSNLTLQNPVFGNGGSITSLLVHVVNTYEAWIAHRALGKKINFSIAGELSQVKTMFESVDQYIDVFLQTFKNADEMIVFERRGIKTSATALKLFTHVVTHEYHHKGQILSLARSLGYSPVDTDVLR